MMFLSKGVFLTFDLGFLHVSIIKHWDDGRFCCIAAIVLWGQMIIATSPTKKTHITPKRFVF